MTAPEFWFYHLESQPLQVVLPLLLEKTLERGWRACVRFSTPERLDTIDSALWTYRGDSFLPHGTSRDGQAARQPVFLTLDAPNPNSAQALFLLETAAESDPTRFARIVRLFGNADEEARALARTEWKAAKEAGFEVSYWRQEAGGTWKKAA
jgi:DNA polymerase-3 subunit chi